ncbi:MAG: hypothetical protein RMJ56_14205, partial [Gemmataceae bacterium]|nr:hypothetical protein [Gemmataceae bacterium]
MSARTRDEAVSRIERYGLRVREVTADDEAAQPPATTPVASDRNGEALSSPEDEPVRPGPSARTKSRGSSSWLSLSLSVVAFVVATAALAVAVLRD